MEYRQRVDYFCIFSSDYRDVSNLDISSVGSTIDDTVCGGTNGRNIIGANHKSRRYHTGKDAGV